jgi:hypothetical protein
LSRFHGLVRVVDDESLCIVPDLSDGNRLFRVSGSGRKVVERALIDFGWAVDVAETGVGPKTHEIRKVCRRKRFASKKDPAKGAAISLLEVAPQKHLDECERNGIPKRKPGGLDELRHARGKQLGLLRNDHRSGPVNGPSEVFEGRHVEVERRVVAEAVLRRHSVDLS